MRTFKAIIVFLVGLFLASYSAHELVCFWYGFPILLTGSLTAFFGLVWLVAIGIDNVDL